MKKLEKARLPPRDSAPRREREKTRTRLAAQRCAELKEAGERRQAFEDEVDCLKMPRRHVELENLRLHRCERTRRACHRREVRGRHSTQRRPPSFISCTHSLDQPDFFSEARKIRQTNSKNFWERFVRVVVGSTGHHHLMEFQTLTLSGSVTECSARQPLTSLGRQLQECARARNRNSTTKI